MATIPEMTMMKPTEEDIAFHEQVTLWLVAFDLLNERAAQIQEVKAFQAEAERISFQMKKDKESLSKRCQWLGRWFIEVKTLTKACYGHGHWQEWLQRHDFAKATRSIQRYMAIARDPQILVEAGYDLSQVTVKTTEMAFFEDAEVEETPSLPEGAGAVEALTGVTLTGLNEGVGEAPSTQAEAPSTQVEQPAVSKEYGEVELIAPMIRSLDKFNVFLETYGDELKENKELITKLNEHHSKLHRFLGLCPQCIAVPKWENGICPSCGMEEADVIADEQAEAQRKLENEQAKVQEEILKETLLAHPIWRYVKSLVVAAGKNAGETRSDKWVIKRYGQGFNGIAQELGYERGTIPPIGRQPAHDMVADERFKWDLMQGFQLGVETGLIKARLTPQARGKRKKQSTAALRCKLIDRWEELGRPLVHFSGGTTEEDLNLVPTSKLKKIRKALEMGQILNINGKRLLAFG